MIGDKMIQKLGIYIGSFNPPHIGHIDVVRYLLKNKYVDKVLIIPTMNYWNKQNLIDVSHRINMLKFYENDLIKVDDKNNNYNCTYELMRHLRKEYKNYDLYLIIGADNIVEFDKWDKYKEILQSKVIVMNRGDIDIKKYTKKYNSDNFIVVSDYKYIDISSTKIRKNLSSEYLDREVFNYIIKNSLFKGDSNE